MPLNLSSDKSSQRDWRGLLLVLIALLIYLLGPLSNHFDKKARQSPEINWDTLVNRLGVDSECGTDPRRAIFLMEPIDLNQADAEVLASLRGIGPELAARIVSYRAQRGGFDSVTDLIEVKGIGPRKLAVFVDEVTISKCAE